MFGNTIGFRYSPLLLFFLLLVILSACTQPLPSKQPPPPSSDPVVSWIKQHAHPLTTTLPEGSDTDLALLPQIIGQASIVGLGEETHGTHEFIDMKARLVEFLISKMGFTTFVMENNWGSSQLLDASINGGPGPLTSVMTQSLFGSWQTQEYQALLEWMRTYNANLAHPAKIHFLGMDIQALSHSDFSTVENYVQRVDQEHAATVHKLYAPLVEKSSLASLQDYFALSASTKQQYQDQAQQVYTLLQTNHQRDIAHSSESQFAFALQNARIIAQFTTYANASTQTEQLAHFYQRDTFLAENVAWIYEHAAGSRPKIMVWAHDGHIANITTYGSLDGRNLGGELHARYQQSYLALGTTLFQGTFRIYAASPSTSIQTIAPAPSTTYNYTLGQAGLPLYLLDVRTLPSGAVSNWAKSSSTFLLYGLGGEDLSGSAQLDQWFDVLLHIQNTTPSHSFYASAGSG